MWLAAHEEVAGAVVPIGTVYELGRRWYTNRLRFDWTRPGAEGAEALFAEVGLTSDFWKLT